MRREDGWARDLLLGRTYVATARILKAVASAFGITVNELMSEGRKEPAPSARLFVYFLMRELTGYSYTQIGRILDRDYTTVRSGHLRIIQLTAENERYQSVCQELQLQIFHDGLSPVAEVSENDPDQHVPHTH